MASLNATITGKMKTTNKCGHAAYLLDDKTKLTTMALTTMLGESKYYGDNTSELIALAEELCEKGAGDFVAKLAVWVRTEGKLRSVSHVLIAVVGHKCSGQPFVRPATRIVASQRGDDGTEILAAYHQLYGDKVRWPHAIQRGVRDALQVATPFEVAKYQSKKKDMKLRDVLCITHPKAERTDTAEAMGKALKRTLPMPKGWETELSARGNTKEVWDELIAENRLGTFAKLRNLRNMLQVDADVDPVLADFQSEEVIAKSRLLPFRFYSAWAELMRWGLATSKVTRALDAAMKLACANVEGLRGRTAVLIDISGSMGWSISKRSQVTCRDIAAVLGALITQVSDDAWVCGFNEYARVIPMAGVSVLSDIDMVPESGGETNMSAPFALLNESDFDADRIVVLSDNEVNTEYYFRNNKQTIQSALEAYRKKVGHDVWCHAIDLQGYGTSQFIGPKVNIMAGWSESVLRFIALAEAGFHSIVEEVESLSL